MESTDNQHACRPRAAEGQGELGFFVCFFLLIEVQLIYNR